MAPARPPTKTTEIYEESKKFVEELLRERGSSLQAMVESGRLEHALMMMWAAVKDFLYRGMVPGKEFEFLDEFLVSRHKLPPAKETTAAIEVTYGDLQNLVRATRQWAWSLRQSVIPIRGNALERIVRLIVGDALRIAVDRLLKIPVSLMDTSKRTEYGGIDYTAIAWEGLRKHAVLGFSIKGNIRERKDESVDTRRRALEARTHDDVWHLFLSEGGKEDMGSFRQINPATDGRVFTWTGIAEELGISGIEPISRLPDDLAKFVQKKLGGS